MKDFFKKIMAIIFASVLFLGVTVSCNGGGGESGSGNNNGGSESVDNGKTDASKTQYMISAYDGAYKQEWIARICNELNALLKDVSFETGKKGVQFKYAGDKSQTTAADIKNGTSKYDLYITSESSPSGDGSEYIGVKNGKIDFGNVNAYDLTDILSAKVLDENGEVTEIDPETKAFKTTDKKSLLDMLDPEIVDEWNFAKADGAPEGKDKIYYFMPFEDVPCGFIVDYDYLTKNGLTGTGIEGMPADMDELYNILERYNGWGLGSGINFYLKCYENAMRAKVDGIEKLKNMAYLFNDAEGYDFNGDGTITDDEKIYYRENGTSYETNAYLATKTRGYLETVKFAKRITYKDASSGDTYFYSGTLSESFKNMQSSFVNSKNSKFQKPIVSIFDGEFWENEAEAWFNQARDPADKFGKRDFRMVPIPKKVTDNDAESKYLLSSKQTSMIVVNPKRVRGNEAKEKLTAILLQYIFSRKGLATINTVTNISMPSYKYELTTEEYNSLTKYAQYMYRLYRNPEFEYFRVSGVANFIKNPSLFIRDVSVTYAGSVISQMTNMAVNSTKATGTSLGYDSSAEDWQNFMFNYYKKVHTGSAN